MRSNDACLDIFFTAIPLAKFLCAVMDGTYRNPDYEKYEKEEKRLKELANDPGNQEYLNEPLVS